MEILKNFIRTILFLVLTSCASSNLKPKTPSLLSSSSPLTLYTSQDFSNDYAAYKLALTVCSKPSALQECTAKDLRDRILNRVKLDVDLNYWGFESQLFLGNAGYNVGMDTVALGLSTAATLAGAPGTKTILAGILTGFQGTRLSIDRNFFREHSIPMIIAKMEVLRDTLSTELEQQMALPVSEFSLEQGWIKLVELFYAGTLQGGLQAMNADAGQAVASMRAQRTARIQHKTSKVKWVGGGKIE
jgi:hypothetical protein